jgi:predicted P-loop ATPase
VFANNQYHPIRDLVDGFEWDGQERIPHFLHTWTKCEDTAYTREVSRLIFSGGIHRLFSPGCKFDDMPVLIGTKQGEGKSTLVRWLALSDDYFSEVNEFEGQRGIESLEGAWICEVSELLAMTKTKEQEAVKSFLTRLNDRYRMPFDKRVTDHPRQCLFIGTTNKEQFLTDKTGNRRFYPVKVNQSGYDLFEHEAEIKEYIRQCWAEAKAKLDVGEMKPYADRDLVAVIREMQAAAVEDDYRVGMIEDYLEERTEVCVLEIWQNALKMGEFSKPSKKDSTEIALILQGFDGWEKQPKVKRFANFGVQKWWRKGEFAADEDMLPL